jgi:hypothetical protein
MANLVQTGTGIAERPHFRIATEGGTFSFWHAQYHKIHAAAAVDFGVSAAENQWLHVSVVADRGAHEQSIIRVRQATGAGQPFLYTSRSVLPIRNIGSPSSTEIIESYCSSANLDIDDVRVYSAALTEKHITDIHDSTS